MKYYGGANGSKFGIIINNVNYMLKFPSKNKREYKKIYTNSSICEDISCRIINTLGLNAQETLLGTYGDKITVACKDFEVDGYILKDFAHLKNSIIDSEESGYGKELDDVLHAIREQQIIDEKLLINFFWEMFVVDAFLGNFDRHNGNWGFLINENKSDAKIAPIYDCASCLYPALSEQGMIEIINDRSEIEQRIYSFPSSSLLIEGVKIQYANFLQTTTSKDVLDAIIKIGSQINLNHIIKIIYTTPSITDTHKQFLELMINERYNLIIQPAIKRAKELI
jgi:hypothetical protein